MTSLLKITKFNFVFNWKEEVELVCGCEWIYYYVCILNLVM